MQDDDLWLLDPENRLALWDEEEINRLEQAADVMPDFVFVASNRTVSEEAMVLLRDARVRAKEAVRRARERLAGGAPGLVPVDKC